MHVETHVIDITFWSKEEILEKIREIFQNYKYVILLHVSAGKLEWQYLVTEPTDLNPSRK